MARFTGTLELDGTYISLNQGGNHTKIQAGSPSGDITITLPATTATVSTLGLVESITGAKTFGDGKLLLAGSSSGAGTIKAPAAASTYVWTLPAATGTLADLALAQTFTNKTLTAPVLTAPVLGTPASGVMSNVTGLPLTTGVTGTLAIGNGGTGQTTQTAAFDGLAPTTTMGDLIVHDGSNNVRVAVGTDGQVLTADSGETSGLTWTSPLTNPMDDEGQLIYGGVSGASTKLAAGAANRVLQSNGAAAPSWIAIDNDNIDASAAIAFSKMAALTVSRALVSSAGGVVSVSAVTATELGYLSGVTGPTGSGALVLANTPTLITPVLGVATATTINKVALTAPATGSTITVADGKTLTASNTLTLTGTDASSVAFGTGGTVAYQGSTLAQFASTTSLELKALISDETGSGQLVFATTPTLVTPILGIATATTINKVAFTAPASGSTLTIADGKTLTASNTLTLTATDGSTAAFGAGGTVAYQGGTLAQFAATTSLELKTLISDETGSGALVFGTSPTLGGTIVLTGTPTLSGAVNFSGGAIGLDNAVVINESGADVDLRMEGDTVTNLFFLDASTDRIGIGTSTPSKKFQIAASQSAVTEGNLATAGALNDGTYAGWYTDSNSRRAGIGIFKHAGIATEAAFIQLNPADNANAYIWTDDSDILRISTNSAHIGTVSGTVVGAQTSDERLKTIHGPLDYGLAEVLALRPIRYTMNGVEEIGFGAQTTQPIIPEAVVNTRQQLDSADPESPADKLVMEYARIVPVLVNAIQELNAKVVALEAAL